jgi:putative tryptophan/tyrosine transport system substrate-binding protein
VKRRDFITLLGGAAAAWPLAARAQQQGVRRIGVFMPGVADDLEFQAFNAAFLQRLAELGWIVGRNARIEYRWGAGDTERYRTIAAELVALAPDVVFAFGSAAVSALQKATGSVPIVFANVADRSAAAWSRVWHGRAATLPALLLTNLDSPESGSSSSRKWCRR